MRTNTPNFVSIYLEDIGAYCKTGLLCWTNQTHKVVSLMSLCGLWPCTGSDAVASKSTDKRLEQRRSRITARRGLQTQVYICRCSKSLQRQRSSDAGQCLNTHCRLVITCWLVVGLVCLLYAVMCRISCVVEWNLETHCFKVSAFSAEILVMYNCFDVWKKYFVYCYTGPYFTLGFLYVWLELDLTSGLTSIRLLNFHVVKEEFEPLSRLTVDYCG